MRQARCAIEPQVLEQIGINGNHQEAKMLRSLVIAVTTSALLTTTAWAQGQFGTAAEARAMLEKAVSAVKADKAKTLDQMQKGEGAFKDRDLYMFCANVNDGILTAHPALKGTKIQTIKDKDGKALGEEMMKVAAEGKVSEVTYMWPRPGDTTPVQKVSFVTKVGDQVCGVGYYK
jgi:signal transduction histidine kinase